MLRSDDREDEWTDESAAVVALDAAVSVDANVAFVDPSRSRWWLEAAASSSAV
ncbi:hypothetical protein PINS_up013660 [Pythium insidiosum]|nr:hypothetical protein PINS_up013660 [Pythium insidiosum]